MVVQGVVKVCNEMVLFFSPTKHASLTICAGVQQHQNTIWFLQNQLRHIARFCISSLVACSQQHAYHHRPKKNCWAPNFSRPNCPQTVSYMVLLPPKPAFYLLHSGSRGLQTHW